MERATKVIALVKSLAFEDLYGIMREGLRGSLDPIGRVAANKLYDIPIVEWISEFTRVTTQKKFREEITKKAPS